MKRNLLKRALRALPKQSVEWFKFEEDRVDDAGYSMPSYISKGIVIGSFQPMEEKDALQAGLSVSKQYALFYTNASIENVERDTSPDYVIYGGKRYDVIGVRDWHLEDGWKAVTLVEVGYE